MPAQYEAIRDKFISEGTDTKEAKTRAAKIYNSKHPEEPVGRYSDKEDDIAPGSRRN
jgi:hypothetical protein